jgi:F-type H+-transporting ATPase subunit alpha
MADLSISTEDIASALRKNLEGWSPELSSETVGYVTSVGDGVARVAGLPTAMASEMLEFPGGLLGVALNLDEDSIGAVVMGESSHVQEGDPVRATGQVLSVPVGDALLGRVVDPLGNPIDGKGTINATERDSGVKCVYVAIGQKASTVAEVVGALEEAGAMEFTVVVNAAASSAAALQMYAPYAGSAIGQYWMYNGEHALVVFDDLSKQAVAYREISLLLRRPPGREAYPGDVFYLHSRLLERCAKLSPELGGGSLTGLPIVETKAGDVSAYIPTNVISITDGQIYLETDLFYSGVRPAINAGISVSRVGGNAQTKAMKTVAGPLRINLAQFRELEAFAEFGSELDAASQAQLERGRRVVEVLKQPQFDPIPVEEQVLAIFAVTEGHMDEVPLGMVEQFETELRDYFRTRHAGMLAEIAENGKLPEGETLGNAVREFADAFVAEHGENE